MIIVDTSVWIDYLRFGNADLVSALTGGKVLQHPFVTMELALGSIAQRSQFCGMLGDLPQAPIVEHHVVLDFINTKELHGTGIGMVDVHLLASTATAKGATLWTRDRRL